MWRPIAVKRWKLVTLALFSCFAIPAIASQAADEWDAIFAQYGIRTAGVVPAGITPLRVDTPAQLRQVIRHATSHGMGQLNMETESVSLGLLAYGVTETSVRLHVWYNFVPYPTFNLWANVWVAGSGSFWEITDVNEWVGLTGITISEDLADTYTFHRIAADRQSVYIEGGGIVNHYLLIRGIIKIYSSRISLSKTYRIR
jgi:hypothetical protein